MPVPIPLMPCSEVFVLRLTIMFILTRSTELKTDVGKLILSIANRRSSELGNPCLSEMHHSEWKIRRCGTLRRVPHDPNPSPTCIPPVERTLNPIRKRYATRLLGHRNLVIRRS